TETADKVIGNQTTISARAHQKGGRVLVASGDLCGKRFAYSSAASRRGHAQPAMPGTGKSPLRSRQASTMQFVLISRPPCVECSLPPAPPPLSTPRGRPRPPFRAI